MKGDEGELEMLTIRRTRGPALLLLAAMLAIRPVSAQVVGEGGDDEVAGADRRGAQWVFELDPAASSVSFELGATLHTVEGTAKLTAGTVRFDPATGSASGRIEVDATSLDTGNENRDEDMHRKVLESATYPDIYFEPRRMSGSFEPTGTSEVTFEGSFGIHGEEHPLELTFDVSGEQDTVSATTEFRVPYVEWGMKDPSKFLLRVEKHVTVKIDAVGIISATEADRGERDDVSSDG